MQKKKKKNAENLDFLENSNFIRRSTEADFRGCSAVHLQENTCGGGLF